MQFINWILLTRNIWEVFRKDKNVNEFVDTLFILERTEFFLNRIENYDEIEDTDSIEDQMQILHVLKEKMPYNLNIWFMDK